MSFTTTIYGLPTDNILSGITPTGTAPMSTYFLTTYLRNNPAARVLYSATSITIVFTLGSSKEGAILVLPISNATGATLTNGAGLSVTPTVPAIPATGIPKTLVYDFSSESNRTSNVWTLALTSGSNLIVGGAIAIFGPKREMDPDFQFGFSVRRLRNKAETQNEYGTRYGLDYRTVVRSIDVVVRMPSGKLNAFEEWHDESCIGTSPSLLWPQNPELDAYFGAWQAPDSSLGLRLDSSSFLAKQVGDAQEYDVNLSFNDLAKGLSVL